MLTFTWVTLDRLQCEKSFFAVYQNYSLKKIGSSLFQRIQTTFITQHAMRFLYVYLHNALW